MHLIIYNFLLAAGLILFSPLWFVKVISGSRYRGRIWARLGFGLGSRLEALPPGRSRLWIHALSVGEVSSVRSLVRAIRARYPDAVIIFTTTTRAGECFARQKLGNMVDVLFPFPVDVPSAVSRFLNRIDPDLFILVETDFWPNFLAALRRRGVPALLVNGRVSAHSFAWYRRISWLFRPLFNSFARLAMQTSADVDRMVALGVVPAKVGAHGNLKYDAAGPIGSALPSSPEICALREGKPLWVAGSTHAGEEAVILRVHRRLRTMVPGLRLVIAPRQVERSGEILELAAALGLAGCRRSRGRTTGEEEVLILDTLGELAGVYALGELAFVGGSLVEAGGHNPLEPAASGRPVLFGPHMEDFHEVAADLCACGGGRMVCSEEELFQAARAWLADPAARAVHGGQALELVRRRQGAVARHLELIEQLLAPSEGERR